MYDRRLKGIFKCNLFRINICYIITCRFNYIPNINIFHTECCPLSIYCSHLKQLINQILHTVCLSLKYLYTFYCFFILLLFCHLSRHLALCMHNSNRRTKFMGYIRIKFFLTFQLLLHSLVQMIICIC